MRNLIPWRELGWADQGSRSIAPFRTELDRLFDRFFEQPVAAAPGFDLHVEVEEDEEKFVVRADAPGVRPDDLEIELTDDVLTIAGEKRSEREASDEEKQQGVRYTERRYGRFQRRIQLPSPVDAEHVEAEHEHGVVTITLAKTAAVRPRKIEVRAR